MCVKLLGNAMCMLTAFKLRATWCSFRVVSKIGEGHFATVSLGSWFSAKGRLTQVAVKQLKPTASAEWRVKFLQEAAIMGQFHHQNIVKMFGVVQVDGEEDNCVSDDAMCVRCFQIPTRSE